MKEIKNWNELDSSNEVVEFLNIEKGAYICQIKEVEDITGNEKIAEEKVESWDDSSKHGLYGITDNGKMEDAIEYLVRTQKAKAIYTPHVNVFGDLTWTNDLELDNPEPVNLMGPRGPQGEAGKSFTYDDMTDEDKADITRDFITCSQNITRIEIVTQYPAYEESNVLYIRVSDII